MCDDINQQNTDDLTFRSQVIELQEHKILMVSGEIDIYSAPMFKQAIMDILDGDAKHLIVDMKNVKYMDSSGIRILLFAANHLAPNSGTVNLIGCASTIERNLALTKMDEIMTLHKSKDDALQAILRQTSL